MARPGAPTLMPAPDCLYTGIFPRNSRMSDYVKWFRHSTPYINTHRDRTFVVLLPGEAIAHPNFNNIVNDLMLLTSLSMRLVLVHCSRPQIDDRLCWLGLTPRSH